MPALGSSWSLSAQLQSIAQAAGAQLPSVLYKGFRTNMVHFPIEFHVLEIGSVEKKKKSALISGLFCHYMQMLWFYQMAMNAFLPRFLLELRIKVEN